MTNDKSLALIDRKSAQALLEYRGEGGNPYRKKFILRRINCQDMFLDSEERMLILQALSSTKAIVNIGEFTIGLSGFIELIPRWGNDEKPPKPTVSESVYFDETLNKPVRIPNEQDLQKLKYWEEVYGDEDENN